MQTYIQQFKQKQVNVCIPEQPHMTKKKQKNTHTQWMQQFSAAQITLSE